MPTKRLTKSTSGRGITLGPAEPSWLSARAAWIRGF